MDGLKDLEYTITAKLETMELINIIELSHKQIITESDVVIKKSHLTEGRIIPVFNTGQLNSSEYDEALFRVVTIGDGRYLSLPQITKTLAIIIPGKASEPSKAPTEQKQQADHGHKPARKPTLSVILPRLAKKAAMSKRNSRPVDKPLKSLRKSDNPVKKSGLSQPKSSLVNKPFTCRQCLVTFTTKYSLKTHQIIQHKEKTYQCEHCSDKFLRKRELIKHLETHPEDIKFTCKACGKRFSGRQALKSHQSVHGPEDYMCDQCPKKFRSKSGLSQHLKSHEKARSLLEGESLTGNSEIDTTCKVCFQQFKSIHALRSHRRVHITGDAPYSCEQCDKRFENISYLRAHLKTHLKVKPLMCENCGMRFLRRDGLRRHMRVHTGEKPYACDYCEKKFARYTTCSEHMRIHTGEKPFVCDFCAKEFRRRTYLNVHLRLHTGEHPFRCKYCEKGYPQKVQLKLHMRSHHPDKPQDLSSENLKQGQN